MFLGVKVITKFHSNENVTYLINHLFRINETLPRNVWDTTFWGKVGLGKKRWKATYLRDFDFDDKGDKRSTRFTRFDNNNTEKSTVRGRRHINPSRDRRTEQESRICWSLFDREKIYQVFFLYLLTDTDKVVVSFFWFI